VANPARPVEGRRDVVIHRDPAAYCSHPCITRTAEGDFLVAFCETLPRRPHLHPPADPRFVNLVARSRDGGATWEAPRVAPGYEWTGMQCPGIARLSSGEVLLSQWQFRWLPLEAARRLAGAGDPRPFLIRDPATRRWRAPRTAADWEQAGAPWARYDGGCFVQVSRDDGATWDETVRVETAPYPRGYSPRPVVELPDGDLLLALGSEEDDTAGEHPTAAFVVRSADRGRTWGPPVAAVPAVPGRWVNEPALLPLPDGRLLLVARERGQHLVTAESGDGGRTWTPPAVTPVWGFPAHAVLLRDGRVLCVYGHRRPPYGIRACLSEDGGRTWRYDDERVVRDDLRNGNCGYPTAVQDPDGSVFVVYYAEDAAGVTHILGSRFRL
jgi:hypothetical protein